MKSLDSVNEGRAHRVSGRAFPSVWLFAFAYFACYVPYSLLAKALTNGTFGERLSGLSLLPASVAASCIAMFATVSLLGWWKHASHRVVFGVSLPTPTRWTFLSGTATGAIVLSTTLAYTFAGVSIPLVMLMMRGGVLLLAPMVDALTGRRVGVYSWIALALSLGGLIDVLFQEKGGGLPLVCVVDVLIYIAAYFVRLRFMSHLAKTDNPNALRRYFVEEQMVATPMAFALIALLSFNDGSQGRELLRGFELFLRADKVPFLLLLGVLSQGTGVFGGLVLLDARENTFCVSMNRASSLLAGVVAAFLLWIFTGSGKPNFHELLGAALIVGAIFVLGVGTRRAKTKPHLMKTDG